MRNIDLDKFSENLLRTQHYCDQQLSYTDKNHAAILRSINPVYKGKPLFRFTLDSVTGRTPYYYFTVRWERDPYDGGGTLIEELFYQQILLKEEISFPPQEKIYKGAIVVYEVNTSVVDGASNIESLGIFDDYDCPPIDTWFYFQNDRLFAWIPEEFLSYAENGIAVNCVDCIQWLAVVYPEMAALLDAKNKWTEFIKNIHGLPPDFKQ